MEQAIAECGDNKTVSLSSDGIEEYVRNAQRIAQSSSQGGIKRRPTSAAGAAGPVPKRRKVTRIAYDTAFEQLGRKRHTAVGAR